MISWFPLHANGGGRTPLHAHVDHTGDTDVQVRVTEGEMLKHAFPDAELVIIEGMNHVLKAAPIDPAQQQGSYSDRALPTVPELIEHIATFITRLAPFGS